MEGEFFHPTHTIHSVDKLCASRGSKSIYTRLSAGIIVKDDRLWWTENGEWIIAGQFLKGLLPGTLEKDAGWKGKRDSEKKKKKTEERERMGGERKRKWRKRLKVEERGGGDIFLERMKAFSPRFGVQLIIFRGNADIPLPSATEVSRYPESFFPTSTFEGKVFAFVPPSYFPLLYLAR